MRSRELLWATCRAAAAATLLLVAACNTLLVPKPDPETKTACEAAGENLARLDCEAAKGSAGRDGVRGTADDETWLQRCESLSAMRLIEPECIAAMQSCDGCRE